MRSPPRLLALVLGTGAFVSWLVAVAPVATDGNYSWDFVPIYSTARCLILGLDPYDDAELKSAWAASAPESSTLTPPGFYAFPMVYPPSTFLVPLTVAWLDWETARPCWLLLNLAALAGTILIATRVWGAEWPTGTTFLFIIYALLANPSREAMRDGQIVPLVVFGLTAALALAERRHELAAGLCLGVSLIKPTLGIGLLVLYALRGRFRLVVSAIAAVLVLNGIVLVEIGPLRSLREHGALVELARSEEAILDAASTRVTKDQLSLEHLLHRLAGTESLGRPQTHAVAIALGAVAAAAVAWLLWLGATTRRDLTGLHLGEVVVLVASLLFFYHRAYDGLILLPILAMLLHDAPRLRGLDSAGVLLCLAAPLVMFLGPHTPWSPGLAGAWKPLEEMVWTPHRVWGLVLFLAAVLAVAISTSARSTKPVSVILARTVAAALGVVVVAGLLARTGVAWSVTHPPRYELAAAATEGANLAPGLLVERRDGIAPSRPIATTVVLARDLSRQTLVDRGGGSITTVLSGYLRVPRAGDWKIELAASDGARLWIDDRSMIDARGFHAFSGKSAILRVSEPGDHLLRIEHLGAFIGNEIAMSWALDGAALEPVPLASLWHASPL